MNIFDELHKDHDKLQKTLQQILESKSAKTRQRQFETVKDLFLSHADAEEQVFYAALEQQGISDALVALEEHSVVRFLMASMDQMDIEDEHWMAKCQVLDELVQHHIEEEESQLFEKAREFLDDNRAKEMAREFGRLKKEAMAGTSHSTAS